MKTPLGRALVEKEAQRTFRHYGLNFSGKYEAETSSNSSDSDPDEMDIDQMDIDELEEVQPGAKGPTSGEPLKDPTSQQKEWPKIRLNFSKGQAKRWLDLF
ncbi:hypothetical protein NW755_006476 [Fusarium falciforme]|uniref:Uncharacterized protein n=1 Tax=Fusarium falciforme TaxID=195108 RepID=A0A9W8R729_9HYPO|nr:hypothetical protein NW755_006476 [Fusarium falciforme]KAJ4255200.1 hypothetical protein NW757_004708 [Fusarium falciforme]